MNKELLEAITKAYEARDLAKLESFCAPTLRKINKNQNYKAALMLSCNNIKHLSKIPNLKADAIILNLEDGVSKEEKPFALVLAAIFLSHLKECDKKLIVRVNSLQEGGYDEITYLNQFLPDAIRVAKIKTPKEVENVVALLKDEIECHLSIETKEAWKNLKLLKVSKSVTAFYLGVLDLFADLGLSQEQITKENPTLHYILSRFLVESRALDVKPISFVYQKYQDLEGFREWLRFERSMGFDAKGCISPKQVDALFEIFGYSEEEIKKAKEIVRLFEENRAKGVTGFTHERYGFIDEPIYKGALLVLSTL